MRKLFVAAATVAIFALLVTPAFAAKGGGKRERPTSRTPADSGKNNEQHEGRPDGPALCFPYSPD